MDQATHEFDGSNSPLGPRREWPAALAHAVDLTLAQGFPTLLCVGPQRTPVYNQAFARLVGGEHPSAPGEALHDVLAQAGRLGEALERVFAGEPVMLKDQPWPLPVPGTADGRWFDISGAPVRDADGAVIAALLVHAETTARVQAERRLAHGEERWRGIVERMHEGFATAQIVYAPDGRPLDFRFLHLNAATEQLTGVSADRIVGRCAGEALPGIEPYWLETFARVVESGQPQRFEYLLGPLQRWLEVYAFRTEPGHFAALFLDVTGRKRVQDALIENEELFRSFAENSTDALWIMDVASRRIEYLSPSFETIWGEPAERMLADTGRWAELLHPQDRARACGVLPELLRTGRTIVQEYRIVRPADGAVRWIRDTGFVIRDHQGQVRRIGGVAHDISERVRDQDALREVEERFRISVANVDDYAMIVLDGEGRVTDWLPGAVAVFGWTAEEMLGQTIDALFAPADRSGGRLARQLQNAQRDGAATDAGWLLRKDGSQVYMEGSLTALKSPSGALRGFMKICQNVSERHRAEEQLRDSESRFRLLTEGLPVLLWRSRDHGDWTWGSPQWLAFTGQTQAQTLGLGWLDPVHPDDRPRAVEAWANARRLDALDVSFRLRRASDGQYVWHHARAAPVRDVHGEITEWLGTTTDIQQLKELQERQEVLVAELQHRTRNLIAVVHSLADKTLQRSGSLGDFRLRFGERLGALARVQGLLSRRGEGERVAFGDLLRAELAAHAVFVEDGERVQLHGPDDIALRSSSVQTLALALHELATNAVKHGALAQPAGRLAIRWQLQDQGCLRIDWRETGVAMPPDSTPVAPGYGRELIERALPYQLKARTTYAFDREGVHCSIELPLNGAELRQGRGHVDR